MERSCYAICGNLMTSDMTRRRLTRCHTTPGSWQDLMTVASDRYQRHFRYWLISTEEGFRRKRF